MHEDSSIFVAGHRGLAGSAIVRSLARHGFANLILCPHDQLDLTDSAAVDRFFAQRRPEYVFLAAARVGGILANAASPVEFLRDNLLIEVAVIEAAYRYRVKKLAFLGSSCIYPKLAPQPIREEYLLTGELEPTNEAYALAKIAGIKLISAYCRQYGFDAISLMPTNLYGPGDNFDLERSHVLPALLRKFHEAKIDGKPEVAIWGSGAPLREFLYVDDLADAAVFLMRNIGGGQLINVGSGQEIAIRDLARLISDLIGYTGEVVYDLSKPDGAPRKLLDSSRLTALGWRPQVTLREGIHRTYEWYLQRNSNGQ
jgi:GDP-L-fucose synthase